MTLTDLIAQTEKRFSEASPGDTATNDRLASFALGMAAELARRLKGGTAPPEPPLPAGGRILIPEWFWWGVQAERFQYQRDHPPKLHFIVEIDPEVRA